MADDRPPTRPVQTLDDLVPDPHNANRGTPRGRAALAHSLRTAGAGRSVLIDRHGVVIAGNKTVTEAHAQGLALRVVETDGSELVAVQRRDLDLASDAQAQTLALADNRVGELDLDWDVTALEALHDAGVDLSACWTAEEVEALFADSARDRRDENAVVAPGPTSFAPGDLIALERHRLLCGDATDPADVARVLDGARPRLMVTDPPYGVAYEPAWRHAAYPQQRTAVGTVTNDDRADWTDAWRLFPGDVVYVWHAALHAGTVGASLHTAAFELRAQIIWAKSAFVLSRGHYHWGHEPAWYAVRRGAMAHWCGDRRQSTLWDVPHLNPLAHPADRADTATGHSTQKPVRLYEIPITNHTHSGESIYDPFAGSGTALIAAERTGRTCLALDIDPVYVQVTVSRWEAFTGQSAVCLGGAS